jgi:N-methylhydantoinase A
VIVTRAGATPEASTGADARLPEPTSAYTADIDIGGTLTDGLITDGTRLWTVKVDTTPHDFTVCFFDCLREAARVVGFDELGAFLARVSVIRWSATIATNVLAEGKGPRVGLIVSPGHEQDLYGPGPSPALGRLVTEADVITVHHPDHDAEVLEAVRSLLERGVRRICVSLAGSFDDDRAELRIKRLVDEQFPDHYLGSVPVLAGSEIARHPDDATRTHLSLINGYVHPPLAAALFRAEDELLSRHRYRRPLYIGHVNGGVARVAKTKGVDTVESGPVFGQAGAGEFAALYGYERVLAVDVGGTTAKVGVLVNHRALTVGEADFFGIPAKIPWLLLRSVSLGGGSVARAVDGEVTLGPESMGAYPGPAAYDLGATEATLTDAFLVAGRLNPHRFLGGAKRLSVERAVAALEEHVGRHLGISADAAADRVLDAAVGIVADTVERTLAEVSMDAHGCELFCFGGNGGNFGAPLAERLGLPRAHALVLGPVLSAFGSSISNVCHVHEEWPHVAAGQAEAIVEDVLARGRRAVLAELEGEGGAPGQADLHVELTVESGGETTTWRGPAEVAEVGRAIRNTAPDGVVRRIALSGLVPVSRVRLTPSEAEAYEASPAGARSAPAGDISVYDWAALSPGARFAGPAMLEDDTNTCVVPDAWTATIDGYRNCVLDAGRK